MPKKRNDPIEETINSVVRIATSYADFDEDLPYRVPSISNKSGTGFVISHTAMGACICTNAHVVRDAITIQCSFPQTANTRYVCTLLWIAPFRDVALVH